MLPRSRWLAATLIVSMLWIGTVTWRSAWNYAGYCRSQGRVLSADERISIAIDDVLQSYPPTVPMPPESKNMQRPKMPIPYSSAQEFKAGNPDCCQIVPHLPEGYAPPLSNRIYGSFASFVRLRYRVRYHTDAGAEETQLVEEHVAISNCGRPWNGF